MRILTVTNVSAKRLLKLAQHCISGALQFDYLSTGAGHRQSAALFKPRAGMSDAKRAQTADRGWTVSDRDHASSRTPDVGTPHAELSPTTADDFKKSAATPQADAESSDRDLVRQYLAEIAKRKRLSSSEEYRLARAARDGYPAARRQLIEHHLGLVVMLARRYCNQGLPLLDLIEEGNIGLMTAIEKFDPEMGYRFSTYARWWICQSIELAVMTQTRVVHIPVHVTRALKRRSKRSVSAAAQDAAQPADGMPDHDLPRDASKFLLYDASDQADASTRHPDREPQPVLDTLAAPEEEQPERHLQLAGLRQRLQHVLAFLNDNERLVIRSRFGLGDDGTPRTLESIATQLQLSSERVRQIQAEALLKLRHILQSGPDQGRDGLL